MGSVQMVLKVGEVLRMVVFGGRGFWTRILRLILIRTTMTRMTKRRTRMRMRRVSKRMTTMSKVRRRHGGWMKGIHSTMVRPT